MKQKLFFYDFFLVRQRFSTCIMNFLYFFFFGYLLVRQKIVDCIVKKIWYGFLLVRRKFGVVYSLNL